MAKGSVAHGHVIKMIAGFLLASSLTAACATADTDKADTQPGIAASLPATGANGKADEPAAGSPDAGGNAAGHAVTDEAREETPGLKLLASIPDRDIALYAKDPSGVKLKAGEREADYDWLYMTPRAISPVLTVRDYDGDGHEELAIITNVGSGTGISLYELHMAEIEVGGDRPLLTTTYESEAYLQQLKQEARFRSHEAEGRRIGEITVGGMVSAVNLDSFLPDDLGNVLDKLALGDIVSFDASEDGLHASFGVGLMFEKAVTPQYVGKIEADVAYSGTGFRLEHLRFEPYEEYKG